MGNNQLNGYFFTNEALEELTVRNPVRKVLGGWYDIIKGVQEFSPSFWAAFFSDSLTSNLDVKMLFGNLIMGAAQNHKWVGLNVKSGGGLEAVLSELGSAEANELLKVKILEKSYSMEPTNALVSYVNSKLRELAPGPFSVKQPSPLTKNQTQAFEAVASLEYSGEYILRISEVLGIPNSKARVYLSHLVPKLGVHDLPSAVYVSLHRGYLSFDDIAGNRIAELKEKCEQLTLPERKVLAAFAAAAREGNTATKNVSSKLENSVTHFTVKNHINEIMSKFGISRRAQLAIYAFYHVNVAPAYH